MASQEVVAHMSDQVGYVDRAADALKPGGDLSLAQKRPPNRVSGVRRSEAPLIVGMNPLPLVDRSYWHKDERGAFEAYVLALAQFADWLLQRGHRVSCVPTQLRVDPGAIHDIRHRMSSACSAARLGQVVSAQIGSLDDLLLHLATLDVVVATRHSSVVLAQQACGRLGLPPEGERAS